MKMRLSDQYRIINEFREQVPVDLQGLTKALGIKVRYAYLNPNISGMLERDRKSGEYAITVNAADAPTRQRFTLSHELGHYMLHRHLVGDGVDDDKAYRSTEAGRYRNTLIGPMQETEANRFAANLLMPYDVIEQVQKEARLNSPASLAKKFQVSEQAMSIRLGLPYENHFT